MRLLGSRGQRDSSPAKWSGSGGDRDSGRSVTVSGYRSTRKISERLADHRNGSLSPQPEFSFPSDTVTAADLSPSPSPALSLESGRRRLLFSCVLTAVALFPAPSPAFVPNPASTALLSKILAENTRQLTELMALLDTSEDMLKKAREMEQTLREIQDAFRMEEDLLRTVSAAKALAKKPSLEKFNQGVRRVKEAPSTLEDRLTFLGRGTLDRPQEDASVVGHFVKKRHLRMGRKRNEVEEAWMRAEVEALSLHAERQRRVDIRADALSARANVRSMRNLDELRALEEEKVAHREARFEEDARFRAAMRDGLKEAGAILFE